MIAALANGAACPPKMGPCPPCGTTHNADAGIPRYSSTPSNRPVIHRQPGQRTREIGVRAALGAGRGWLVTMVVGQGLMLAVIGVAAGAAAAAGLGRFVEAQLYGVQPLDIVSFGATGGVTIATALVASLVPALRALRVDPMTALRQ